MKEIKVTNGRASGVRLASGETIEARRLVVSAIDAPTTSDSPAVTLGDEGMVGPHTVPRCDAR